MFPINLGSKSSPVTHIIRRQRLLLAIDEQLLAGALWVQAPAGMGKSTLIRDYTSQSQRKIIWYSLDSRDQDLGYFLAGLNQACHKKLVSRKTIGLINKPFALDCSIYLDSIYEKFLVQHTEEIIFVFDNCEQLCEHSEVSQALASLGARNHENVKVIYISRTAPPPEFSDLLVKRKLNRFANQDLNFTRDEFEQYLAQSGLDIKNANDLYQMTGGWVAGIILMLESMRFNCQLQFESKEFDYYTLFSYIASEIFHSSSKNTQRLLLSVCLLSSFTVKQAKLLSGISHAESILLGLCRNNYFTVKQNKTYSFHPLLVRFLRSLLYQKSEDEIQRVYAHTVRLLLKQKEYEQIMELCLEREQWDLLTKLLRKYSNRLISQGKIEFVRTMLHTIPKPILKRDGWLLYWLGTCYQPKQPEKATQFYRDASTVFEKHNDSKGFLLSVCGETESVGFYMDDYRTLSRTVREINRFEQSGRKYPSLECYARVAANMHTAILFSHPDKHELERWEKKIYTLTRLLQVTFQVTNRILIGMGLFYQMFFQGRLGRARIILDSLKPTHLWDDENNASQIAWHAMNALLCWFEADFDKTLQSTEIGIRLSESTGLKFFQFPTLLQSAYASLNNCDLDVAQDDAEKLERYRIQNAKLKSNLIDNYQAELELKKGNYALALEYSTRATQLEKHYGMKIAYALFCIVHAEILIHLKEFEKARETISEIAQVSAIIGSHILDYHINWLSAKIELEFGNTHSVLVLLEKALTIGARENYLTHFCWIKKDVSQFYQIALKYAIQEEYVRKVCAKRDIPLDETQQTVTQKPIQIQTFGGFDIVIHGKKIMQSRKAKRKPIELLKVLVASRYEWVDQETIQDQLWPDSEGDAAAQAVYTTLHRLRKLLGQSDIIERRDGKLRLNRDQVDTDIDRFYLQVNYVMRCLHEQCNLDQCQKMVDELQNLLQLHFLPHDSHIPSVLHTRAQLTRKCNALFERLKVSVDYQQEKNSFGLNTT